MIRIMVVLIIAALTQLSMASAQSRDVYTVRGISVDESAPTLIEAQQLAFSAAKLVGADEIINRITLPEDRALATELVITAEVANLMAAAVDVEEETAGAGRYRGRLAVVFNPTNVRAVLEQSGVSYTDQAAPRAVLIPVAEKSYEAAWNSSWGDLSEARLAPTVTSRTIGFSADSTWTEIGGDAALYGAQRGLIAELLGRPGGYRVTVSSITPSGVRQLGTTRRVGSLAEAVVATGDLIDDEWKRSSIIRDKNRTLIESTVRYTSLAEWNTLRSALANSPLISDFQTKAVSTDGAVVAFVFAGDGQRLVFDLRDRGVEINMDTIGWVMTSAVTSAR